MRLKLLRNLLILTLLSVSLPHSELNAQNFEIYNLSFLTSGGNYPGDTIAANNLPQGGTVDIRYQIFNNTGSAVPTGDTLSFAFQSLIGNDTVLQAVDLELNNPLADQDTLTFTVNGVLIPNDQGSGIYCVYSLNNADISDGLLCRPIETGSPQQITINAFDMISPGGSFPADVIDSDSIPTNSTVDVSFEIRNELGSDINPNDNLNFVYILVIGNDTIDDTYTATVQQTIPDQSTERFTIPGVQIPDQTGPMEFCILSLDNNPIADGSGCRTFQVVNPVSVEELAAQSMNVYAGHNELVIEAGEVSGLTHVAVFDMTGKQVFNRNVNLFPNNNERFNMNSLSKGIYIVRLSQNNQMIKTNKVIFR